MEVKILERNLLYHLIVQYIITWFPPAVAAIMLNVNPYISNIFEEFIAYSVGVTGLIPMAILLLFHFNPLIVMLIFFVIKIFVLYPFFVFVYLKSKRVKWLPFMISSLLSLWGVFLGFFWMVAAMQ